MGEDEKLQLKKDILWDIREKNAHVECLKQQINRQISAMKQIVNLWENNNLGVKNGKFINLAKFGLTEEIALDIQISERLIHLFTDLSESESEPKDLDANFNKLMP